MSTTNETTKGEHGSTGEARPLPRRAFFAAVPLAAGATLLGAQPAAADPIDDLRADLADTADAAKGAALVGYRDTVAPTYLKTVSDIINGDSVSVMRFIKGSEHSAIRAGTSTYDAAGDIQSGLDAAKSLHFPRGRYGIKSTLKVNDGTSIVGDGWTAARSGASVQAPVGSVIRLLPGANCDMVRQSGTDKRYSLSFRGIALDGDGGNQTSVPTPDPTTGIYQFNRNGFYFTALYNTRFIDVFVYNMRGAGWLFYGSATPGLTNVFLQGSQAYNCRTYCLQTLEQATDVRVFNGDFGFGRVANVSVNYSATLMNSVFWTSQCQDITNPATHASGTGPVVNAGIILEGANNLVHSCRIEGNAGHGVLIRGGSYDNSVTSSEIYYNSSSTSTSGSFDGVYVAGGTSPRTRQVSLISNRIRQATSPALTQRLRRAVTFESGHEACRMFANDVRHIKAQALVAADEHPVVGLADGDETDFSWADTKVRAAAVGSQVITGSTVVVAYADESLDFKSNYDASTSAFTAGEYGHYRIEASLTVDMTSTDARLSVYVDGVEVRRLAAVYAKGPGQYTLSGTATLTLTPGQVVTVRAASAASVTVVGGEALSWLAIDQVAD